jgi:RNA-directed DNA polymerase
VKGQTEQERSDREADAATDDAARPGWGESRHDGKHGNVQEQTMMEQVLAPENMREAWRRVKANAGAPGIDGMTVEAFPAFVRGHWPRIHSALMAGTYRPAAVRRVFIPKPDGSQRPLGVPTVLDRVIQQALAQVLTPLFDGGFSDHSYGFREGRSAHQALRHVETCWQEGRRYAVDCDLKSFFDTVNHDRLMGQLREKIRDRKVLGLIRRYLQAGVVLPDGTREATPQGVPQGGPLSPLLANITLDPLDKELERRGHQFARYADDFLVMVKSPVKAERLMASLTRFVEGVRRRVRMYYWKQWKRPGTRRRHLLALGIPREEVHRATRSRKGYWRMSGNSIVQRALTNRWLHEQGVPDMRTSWCVLHYGPKARV